MPAISSGNESVCAEFSPGEAWQCRYYRKYMCRMAPTLPHGEAYVTEYVRAIASHCSISSVRRDSEVAVGTIMFVTRVSVHQLAQSATMLRRRCPACWTLNPGIASATART